MFWTVVGVVVLLVLVRALTKKDLSDADYEWWVRPLIQKAHQRRRLRAHDEGSE
jgi:hypothetical protein